ncbi:MAG: hypothetical protein HOI95_06575 [Chromatiales bacterium]|jgi:putative transposase|nr:hypothetical protein [Chromatiales bacterium]
MATPRSKLVSAEHALCYHLVSRCVRGAWCLGIHEGRNYNHRKQWIERRVLELSTCFAVELLAFAVMSNHFHLVVFYDPNVASTWSNEEVVDRWMKAFPPNTDDVKGARALMLGDPKRIERARATLGCMSKFMKHLKQPIAFRANREDEAHGHFFEKRFYSGALIDEESTLATMMYVDLNPFRANIAATLKGADATSIQWRLKKVANSLERLEEWVAPVASGVARAVSKLGSPSEPELPCVPRIPLSVYIARLQSVMDCVTTRNPTPAQAQQNREWTNRVALLNKRQRAYGDKHGLERWATRGGFRLIEKPLH